jgi:hypothetical protein
VVQPALDVMLYFVGAALGVSPDDNVEKVDDEATIVARP